MTKIMLLVTFIARLLGLTCKVRIHADRNMPEERSAYVIIRKDEARIYLPVDRLMHPGLEDEFSVAHELWHVWQAENSSLSPAPDSTTEYLDDAQELEANAFALALLREMYRGTPLAKEASELAWSCCPLQAVKVMELAKDVDLSRYDLSYLKWFPSIREEDMDEMREKHKQLMDAVKAWMDAMREWLKL